MRRILLVGSIAALTAACGDSDPLNLNGTLSFNHSGSVNGTFNATGRIPLFGEFGSTAWAAGGRDVQNGGVVVTAVIPASSPRFHMVVIAIPRLNPGSSTISVSCTTDCASVFVEFDASEDDTNASHTCFLDAGTVAISSISDNRASGNFSGSGSCTNALNVTTSFAISNGSFDVPLISEGSLP